jgi:hypothetical protein
MTSRLLCCEILRTEVEHLLQNKNVEINYLEFGLHTDFKKLESSIKNALESMENSKEVSLGSMCHPEMEQIAAAYGKNVLQAKNCIEIRTL